MNLIVLLSGPSTAFKEAGYAYPKNLVDIGGKPLVQHVLENLSSLTPLGARLVCVLRKEENRRNHTGAVVHLIDPKANIVELQGETAGAACSALAAIDHIDADEPLIVVNGDQVIKADLRAIVEDFQRRKLDGGIVVFEDVHPRWSFVKCDADGYVVEAAEKRPISKLATAGFYYFRRGQDFVTAAVAMIKKDAHVNNRFYVCPAFNELILLQQRIGVHAIRRQEYQSLATPGDLKSLG